MKSEKTVLDLQMELESALRRLPSLARQLPEELKPLLALAPTGEFSVHVSLRRAETDRQVKRTAPADRWSPGVGLALISYNKASSQDQPPQAQPVALPLAHAQGQGQVEHPLRKDLATSPAVEKAPRTEDPVSDLVRSLIKAESRPEFGFVALKWFRDAFLPQEGYHWAVSPESRHQAMKEAIQRNWVLKSQIPNPKNPQFPVTTIRVNRPLAEIRVMVDEERGTAEFAPITIRGERLSETILRERR